MDWWTYGSRPSVAQQRAEALDRTEALRAEDPEIEPTAGSASAIPKCSLAGAWQHAVEAIDRNGSRAQRARSYLLNEALVDLKLQVDDIQARGSGSALYSVRVRFESPSERARGWMKQRLGRRLNAEEQLAFRTGRFCRAAVETLADREARLMPLPSALRVSCDCFDGTWCKHVLCALMGVSLRLADDPMLLMRFRGLDVAELLPDVRSALPALPAADDTFGAAAFGVELDAEALEVPALEEAEADASAPGGRPPIRCGAQLLELLDEHGWTAKELARRIGVTPGTASSWFHAPDFDHLSRTSIEKLDRFAKTLS